MADKRNSSVKSGGGKNTNLASSAVERLPQSNTPEVSQPSILARLSEYKETITIVLFFIGGVFWIYSIFATKNQIKQLKCLLNTNISLIQNQTNSKILLDDIIENELILAKIITRKTNGLPRDDDSRREIELNNAVKQLRIDQQTSSKLHKEALLVLQREGCSLNE